MIIHNLLGTMTKQIQVLLIFKPLKKCIFRISILWQKALRSISLHCRRKMASKRSTSLHR